MKLLRVKQEGVERLHILVTHEFFGRIQFFAVIFAAFLRCLSSVVVGYSMNIRFVK